MKTLLLLLFFSSGAFAQSDSLYGIRLYSDTGKHAFTAGAGSTGQVLTGVTKGLPVFGATPFAAGGNVGTAATPATTGTMSVSMTTAVVTITPTAACTFTASGGVTGQLTTFVITTSGTSSFTLTWSTNFKATSTLATGTSSGKKFCVTFRCIDGTLWYEVCRTIAM